ncbi:hypothetical protein [Mycobacterium bourgelatii]|uniref:DUF732 domain-containing protein n=1 Tax=Mycobacterium bourgelatii TaxID=1273442 RepID=A0A7I9YL45_MYCBU|nr:hypothetical protein [Mycobacterium bourgelatii]MCV6977990.1 hypothetical protein [Mycobacterium bourgelatii]GFG89404.1 hypothetical protein MBOU_14460 [Mycobacterium bourgelatii]
MTNQRKPIVAAFMATVAMGVMPTLAVSAHADPGDQYNDGLATSICQLLVQEHWTPQRVVTELVSSFPREIVANDADGYKMLRWAVATKCPGAA